ncbi:MAG: periplasmic heavy metal sensor [Syntrophobacterales bacterium]|nr:periplasmic heavy metal sensor [Syntrophobacterales bacterium]
MLRKTLSVMVLVAMMGIPVIVMGAQDMPHGKWWHNPEVSKQMNLTEEEIGSLDKAYLENRRNLIDLKGKLEKERLELEILFENEKLNETEVSKQFGKVENARTRLSAERFRFIVEVRKIIGLERYRTLKTSFDKFRKQMRHRIAESPKGGPGKSGPGRK